MQRIGRHRSAKWRATLVAALSLGLPWLSAHAQIIPTERPDEIKGLDIKERLGGQVDLGLEFTDSTGKRVTLGQYFRDGGKPVVLALVYFRCPMQCPTIMNNMVARFNELDWSIGEKYNVVVVSFDPTETPKAAAEQKLHSTFGYSRPHPKSLDASWAFLTGDAINSRRLADQVGFMYRYLPESNEYSHPTVIFVLTPEGVVSRYLYGVNYPSNNLRMALMDASGGKIGTLADRLLMFCFHYDPAAGAYSVSAMRVMQVGGAAAAGLVGLVMGRMWMIERRRRRTALAALTGPIHPAGQLR